MTSPAAPRMGSSGGAAGVATGLASALGFSVCACFCYGVGVGCDDEAKKLRREWKKAKKNPFATYIHVTGPKRGKPVTKKELNSKCTAFETTSTVGYAFAALFGAASVGSTVTALRAGLGSPAAGGPGPGAAALCAPAQGWPVLDALS